MARRLERKLGNYSLPARVVRAPAEHLPFESGSFDFAVSTLVLCTVVDPERALAEVPVLRMLHEPLDGVRARAEELARLTGGEAIETQGRVGGGALPLHELPSVACALAEDLAGALRAAPTPVVAVVRDGRTLLDCRTISDSEVAEVAEAVASCSG